MRLLTFTTITVIHFSVAQAGLDKLAITRHPAWQVINKFECGESAADRIIGGKNALLGQFPWIARLGYIFPDDDNEMDWLCGGALITDRIVVTAAHCMPSPEDDYRLTTVLVGEHNTDTNPDCELGVCAPSTQARLVKNISKHPDFNNPTFHNDIAIIELQTPVELNDYVSPICLPQNDEQLNNMTVGELVSAAGWGKVNMTTERRAKILQVVALPVVDARLCDLFGHEFRLSEKEICAGSQFNKDACSGDSGGPLMKVYDTPEGPKSFLVGVVSFGPTICGIKKPGVYTSVAHFLPWILDYVLKH